MHQNQITVKKAYFVMLGFVVLMLCFIVFMVKKNTVSSDYEEVSSILRSDNVSVYYELVENGMLCYSTSGVVMTDQEGHSLWTHTWEMNSPVSIKNDQYVLIGDKGGNAIYIVDQYGCQGEIKTGFPIQSLNLSDQNIIGVISTDAKEHVIQLYNMEGHQLLEIKASFEKTGYPLDLTFTDQATEFVVSYLIMEHQRVKSKVVFYDFDDKKQDKIKHEQVLEGICPQIEKISDQTIVVFGENQVLFYNNLEEVQLMREWTFEDSIRSVFSLKDQVGIVLDNHDEQGIYRLELFDAQGEQSAVRYFELPYQHMNTEREIIFYNEDEMLIFNQFGKLLFNGELDRKIIRLMPSWSKNSYWLIDDLQLTEIRIK